MKKNYDYKKYVYLKVPRERYEEIIKNKEAVFSSEVERWRYLYEKKLLEKKIGANIANKVKQKRVLEKILKALQGIKDNLFLDKEEKKDITAYKLAKLANINYLTAKKYWTKELKERWQKNPDDAILDLKLMMDHI